MFTCVKSSLLVSENIVFWFSDCWLDRIVRYFFINLLCQVKRSFLVITIVPRYLGPVYHSNCQVKKGYAVHSTCVKVKGIFGNSSCVKIKVSFLSLSSFYLCQSKRAFLYHSTCINLTGLFGYSTCINVSSLFGYSTCVNIKGIFGHSSHINVKGHCCSLCPEKR